MLANRRPAHDSYEATLGTTNLAASGGRGLRVFSLWALLGALACSGDPKPEETAGTGAGTSTGGKSGTAAAGGAGAAAGGAGAGRGAGTGAGTISQAGAGGSPSAGSAAGAGAGVGAAGNRAGTGGIAANGGRGGNAGSTAGASGANCTQPGATEHFSFFVTSLAGLQRLSSSQNGFGGDLRYGEVDGLTGADKICRELAEASSPGASCKTWRAFLSVTKDKDGKPVNAGDRIGNGPWYDRTGRLVAMNKSDLLQAWPKGADSIIMYDLPNELGVPNHNPDGKGQVDNHNTITGTSMGGTLTSTDWAFTCHDWTSKVGTDGTPRIGFSWRGGAALMNGSSWYSSSITEGGCADMINLTNQMDFNARGIGARGGYGGFYCLALTP